MQYMQHRLRLDREGGDLGEGRRGEGAQAGKCQSIGGFLYFSRAVLTAEKH